MFEKTRKPNLLALDKDTLFILKVVTGTSLSAANYSLLEYCFASCYNGNVLLAPIDSIDVLNSTKKWKITPYSNSTVQQVYHSTSVQKFVFGQVPCLRDRHVLEVAKLRQ